MAKKAYIGVGGSTESRLPAGYTELEYIESTSDSAGAGEQYIDTEVIPSTNDFSVVMKASARVIDAENWFLTINRQMPAGTATFLQFGVRGNSTFATHLTYVAIDGTTAATTDIVDITFSVQGTTATQTGDATHTMTNTNLQSGSYRNSSITIVNGNWRCYSCQIYLANTLVRDFVPCKSASGEVGLYDKVNAQFYGNAGNGSFTAGSTIMDGARQVKKMYIGVDGVARKVKKAYIGVNGVARLFYSGVADVAALAISYSASGGMTDAGIVTMSGKQYRLLTITKSGTLSVSEEAQAEVWMCGGGTSGESSLNNTDGTGAGGGGGAGAFTKAGNVKLSGSMVATIGAGGAAVSAGAGGYTVGGASTFAGLSTSMAFTQQGVSCGVNGGTGGGDARDNQYSTVVGKGDGVTKYPFGDSAYFAHPHCAGGGGGNVRTSGIYTGGDGGTNGGNGITSIYSYARGGAGGDYGGGAGGAVSYNNNRPMMSSASSGEAATYYGSAGGGGAFMNQYPKFGGGGAGYQGIIYIRIPVDQ